MNILLLVPLLGERIAVEDEAVTFEDSHFISQYEIIWPIIFILLHLHSRTMREHWNLRQLATSQHLRIRILSVVLLTEFAYLGLAIIDISNGYCTVSSDKK